MDRSIGRLSDGQTDKLDQIDRWKYRQRDRKKGEKKEKIADRQTDKQMD
jgi:hypothetical protein